MEIKLIDHKYYLVTSTANYLLTPTHLQKYSSVLNGSVPLNEQIASEILFDYAYNDACKLLSFSNKTSFEIKQKLLSKNYSFLIIDQVITKLTDLKMLNDDDYVKSFAQNKITNYGKRIIILKLREKGLSEDVINTNLADIFEEPILEKKIPLKLKAHKGSFRIIKEKVHHYFYQKGYESSLVNKIINYHLPLLKLNPMQDLKDEYKKVQVRFNGYQNNLKLRNSLIKYLQKKCFSVEDILEIID